MKIPNQIPNASNLKIEEEKLGSYSTMKAKELVDKRSFNLPPAEIVSFLETHLIGESLQQQEYDPE